MEKQGDSLGYLDILSTIAIFIISGCATSSQPRAQSPEPVTKGGVDAITQASPQLSGWDDEVSDASVQMITAYEVRQKQLRQEDVLIIDVRSRDLHIQSHIQGAISLPLAELEQRYRDLPWDRELILYCGGYDCPLSKTAAKRLMKLGFVNVKDMQEGIAGWENQGFPVTNLHE